MKDWLPCWSRSLPVLCLSLEDVGPWNCQVTVARSTARDRRGRGDGSTVLFQ
jgi:hypothetical protein